MDYHDGKYGVNTDPERGADTFIPFHSGTSVINLGKVTTANLSSYPNYKNYTKDNFIIKYLGCTITGHTDDGKYNENTFYLGPWTASISYDSSTGIVTVSNINKSGGYVRMSTNINFNLLLIDT